MAIVCQKRSTIAVSQKRVTIFLPVTSLNVDWFQNSFTGKSLINSSLEISSNFNHVATLLQMATFNNNYAAAAATTNYNKVSP